MKVVTSSQFGTEVQGPSWSPGNDGNGFFSRVCSGLGLALAFFRILVLMRSLEPDLENKTCRIFSVLFSCLQCMPGSRTPLSPGTQACPLPTAPWKSEGGQASLCMLLATKGLAQLVDIRTRFSVWKLRVIISPSLFAASFRDRLGRDFVKLENCD